MLVLRGTSVAFCGTCLRRGRCSFLRLCRVNPSDNWGDAVCTAGGEVLTLTKKIHLFASSSQFPHPSSDLSQNMDSFHRILSSFVDNS